MSEAPRPRRRPRPARLFYLRVVGGVTLATAVVLVTAALAVWRIERDTPGSKFTGFPDALWWAMETLSTVGYGDIHPVTTGGRFVAVVLMVLGIALIGIISATVVTWVFTELDVLREVEEIEQTEVATLRQVLAELRDIRDELTRRGSSGS